MKQSTQFIIGEKFGMTMEDEIAASNRELSSQYAALRFTRKFGPISVPVTVVVASIKDSVVTFEPVK